MFVRFTRRVTGQVDGKDYEAERGDVRDLPETEAERLIRRNHAEAVPALPAGAAAAPAAAPAPAADRTESKTEPPTAATVTAPERAVAPRARGRYT